MRNYLSKALVILILAAGCKEPYVVPAIARSPSYLVVDGFINTGQDKTMIKLSRTRGFSDSSSSPELNAKVTVLDDNFNIYPLSEKGNGIYEIDQLTGGNTQKYQLEIVAADGKKYISNLLTPLESPPIDSLHWEIDPTGVHIFVNTHDPQNNVHYYRWGYEETWDHRAAYNSLLIYQDDQIQIRPADRQIYRCWASDSVTDLILASSANLAQDVIYRQPLKYVPMGGDQMRFQYSIIVYQYALSEEEFDYWQNLKKNTEQLGTLFDAQPFSLTGNVRCTTNPEEPVLGYVGAFSPSSKRIFIKNEELPYWYYYPPYICDTLYKYAPGNVGPLVKDTLLFVPIDIGLLGIIEIAATECGDCRYGGAVNTKPSFWP